MMKTWIWCALLCVACVSHAEEEKRRALPAPFKSPPFPSAEYQGNPLIGVPVSDDVYPLMKLIYDTPGGNLIKESGVKAYGWVNVSGNRTTNKNSNLPFGYWIVPNRVELDQFVFRIERSVNTVQMDHVDFGFRSTFLYGIDYRFLNAGGWTSWQLLAQDRLYGYDFGEQYLDIYTPNVAQGMITRIGRWVSCPDIEDQFVTDNYMGSHSLLFIYDTFTQTGLLFTIMLNKYWTIQAGIHAGTDMAPWYKGAVPTGLFGVRWVSHDNRDSLYVMLNSINTWKFRRFRQYGQKMGHDNYNYLVGTWQHKISDAAHIKTEGYFMWQRDTAVGGTSIAGRPHSYGGGGGLGPTIPGCTWAYGVVNYAVYAFSEKEFITLRNEIWRDVDGERTGYRGTYSTHALGLTHNFNEIWQVRPEIGYYRNWNHRAFDLGKKHGMILVGIDTTVRF